MNEEVNLIPRPRRLRLTKNAECGTGISSLSVECPGWSRLKNYRGGTLKFSPEGRPLRVRRDNSLARQDEYYLRLDNDLITVSAADERAAFYGIMTLMQLERDHGLAFTGGISDWADLKMRIVMVDLKRLGWNFDYLLGLLERFATLKINYAMIEYEDKFPFDFCRDIPVTSAFTREQIRELNRRARQNFIEIIPLVQCLAHYEYILKHEKYRPLRENPLETSQACPRNPRTFELFKKMGSEVMAMHPDSKYFHVGGDEPFLLGYCPDCAKFAKKHGVGKLYAAYLNRVLEFVKESGKIPIFWGDVIKHHPDAAGACSKNAIAVNWNYDAEKLRGKEVFYAQDGILYLDYASYEKLPFARKQEVEKNWRPDRQKRDFDVLAYGAHFKQRGFKTLGGSNVNNVDNVLVHAQYARANALEGQLATYWASFDSLKEPFTVYETRMPGVIMLAASSWNTGYETRHRNTFFGRAFGRTGTAGINQMFNGRSFIIPFSNAPLKNSGCIGTVRTDCGQVSVLNVLARKLLLEKELTQMRNTLFHVPLLPQKKYRFLDLSPFCNTRFSDTPEHPGWTGEGINDERFFPRGKFCFNGVPFHVMKETAKNKTVVFCGSWQGNPEYREQVEIPVGFAAGALTFLHTVARGGLSLSGEYIIHYEDGKTETVELQMQVNIGVWWNIQDTLKAPAAAAVKNLFSARHPVGFHTYSYSLRRPENKIRSIELVCRSKHSLIGLCGITAILSVGKNEIDSTAAAGIKSLGRKFERLHRDMQKVLPDYLSQESVEEVTRFASGFSMDYLKRKLRGLA